MKEININVKKIPDSSDTISDISFSKAFKRLSDKTQMCETRISEHYTTRLTHTIEVMSIACSLCDKINDALRQENVKNLYGDLVIDKNIIISMSLAHDLGHTPFGHIGEKTIFELLKQETKYCFKHNIFSAKILLEENIRENRHPQDIFSQGIDWQIIDGVIKHTKCYPKNFNKINGIDYYNLKENFSYHHCFSNKDFQKEILEFIGESNNDFVYSYLNYENSLTLAGQIIAISDEIAQRISDLDDAIRLLKKRRIKYYAETDMIKKLRENLDYVKSYLSITPVEQRTRYCKSTINYCEHVLSLINEININDELTVLNVSNRTRDFYINNLSEYLVEQIEDKKILYKSFSICYTNEKKKEKKVIYYLIKNIEGKPFISFDESVEILRNQLNDFSYNNIHNANEIQKSNNNGAEKITNLFYESIKDYTLLDRKTRKRLLNLYNLYYENTQILNEEDCLQEIYSKFNDNSEFKEKCFLIILEGISMMSNNYLIKKLNKTKNNNQ